MDTTAKLALAMQASPGTTAVLLGSGVSTGAGILTGWQVTEDLCRRLAQVSTGEVVGDGIQWYLDNYRMEPSYSDLLSNLAPTTAGRRDILREYFEPNEDERERGLKVPSESHKAIARLVRNGAIRIILTTNFDRLMESALRAEGIEPIVLVSGGDIEGAPPLAHCNCIIIKCNGDYLDSRFRNTEEELSIYPDSLSNIINQVVEEYGLVISGWSADWDIALREIIAGRVSKRYLSVWTHRGEVSERVKELITAQGFEECLIKDSDSFFVDVEERYNSSVRIGNNRSQEPNDIERVKRLLEDENILRLEEIIIEKSQALTEWVRENYQLTGSVSRDELRGICDNLSGQARSLCVLLTQIGKWPPADVGGLLVRLFDLISSPGGERSGNSLRLELKKFPSLVCLYGIGIPLVARRKYSLLATIFNNVRADDRYEALPISSALSHNNLFERGADEFLNPEDHNYHYPVSIYMQDIAEDLIKPHMAGEREFIAAFDEFEFLLSMDGAYRWTLLHERPAWFYGQWLYRGALRRDVIPWLSDAKAAIDAGDWGPVEQGMFDGDREKMSEVLNHVMEVSERKRML